MHSLRRIRVSSSLRLSRSAALRLPQNTLLGGGFSRIPEGSTRHYTAWCNSLTQKQLYAQQYRELTVVQPTWMLHRAQFEAVGGYVERQADPPAPEDLIFFHKHLDIGGRLHRLVEDIVVYRFVEGSVSWRIPRRVLLRERLRAFERRVLSTPSWRNFTVWGAGRDGRAFINELSEQFRERVVAFCDVDSKKVGTTYYNAQTKMRLPIVHFSEAKPPIVCCVAMGRTDGALEANVASMGLDETVNFWHFN